MNHKPLEKTRAVGTNFLRVDAEEKARGTARYPQDLSMAGMLTARLLLAGRPRAVIRAVDTARAREVLGVTAVFTAADVPHNLCGQIIADCPVLCSEHVYYAGDKVALVVAETEAAVDKAISLISVDYEELPPLLSADMALADGAPLVHPEWGSNLISEVNLAHGDVDSGFARADVIIESEYHTGAQEHAFLAPEAGLAYIDEQGRVSVETAGQWAHDDQRQIAAALQLPEDRVRVIYRAIGGAFGGREDVSVQIVLALAAWKLQKPVKMVWSRQESLTAHHKRHQVHFKARLGATRDGKLTAARVEVLADGGAYISTSMPVLSNAVLFCCGPYNIPNTALSGKVVYTNNIPGGAMRGFGALQGNFCAEMQMNKMASALGLDPVEFRMRNLITTNGMLPNGSPLPAGAGAALKTIKMAANAGSGQNPAVNRNSSQAIDSRRARGIGFACGWKNNGLGGGVPDFSEVIIECHGTREIERVVLRSAGADVGQGTQTVMTQITADALGVNPKIVEIIGSDTAQSPPAGTSSASRMTMMAGNAVLLAASAALKSWQNEERPAIGRGHYDAPVTAGLESSSPENLTHYSLGFTAGFAEVEVDRETGAVDLISFTSALDAGRSVNPKQVEGQAEGGLVQAIGWTLMEKFIQQNGRVQTDNFATYLLPTVLDVPNGMKVLLVESPDEHGPYGARGIGELPMLTAAPAIMSAIHNAVGVWVDLVPARAEDVWKEMRREA